MTGDSIAGTGLSFDTETGVLSGVLTNTTTLDPTFTVEENISKQTQTYTIQLNNTTVTVQNIEIKFAGVNRIIDYDALPHMDSLKIMLSGQQMSGIHVL